MGFLSRIFGTKTEKKVEPADKPVHRQTFQLEEFLPRHFAFSPDGKFLVVAGGKSTSGKGKISFNVSGKISILTAEQFNFVKNLEEGTWPATVTFSKDGKSVIGLIGRALKIWDFGTGKHLATIDEDIELISISPQAESALAKKRDGTLSIIDIKNGKKNGPFSSIEGQLLSVSIDQSYVVHSENGKLFLRDVARSEDISFGSWSGGEISAVAVSPDATMLAIGSGSGYISLWNLNQRSKILDNDSCKARINKFCFSPDSSFLAYGGVDGGFYFMDIQKPDIHLTLESEPEPVMTLAYSPDGTTVLSVRLDGKIRVWSVPHKTGPAHAVSTSSDAATINSLAQSDAPSLQEVQCICILPNRFAAGLSNDKLKQVLSTCLSFVGSQIASRYKMSHQNREFGAFTNDPVHGVGVSFLWRVPAAVRETITADTKREWEELMMEIDRHGVDALLQAGNR